MANLNMCIMYHVKYVLIATTFVTPLEEALKCEIIYSTHCVCVDLC